MLFQFNTLDSRYSRIDSKRWKIRVVAIFFFPPRIFRVSHSNGFRPSAREGSGEVRRNSDKKKNNRDHIRFVLLPAVHVKGGQGKD